MLRRHSPLLVKLFQRVLDDPQPPEDAVREAALQAMLGPDRMRRPERFLPWLAGIGIDVCRRWFRHRARQAWTWEAAPGGGWSPELPAPDADPALLAEEAELHGRTRDAGRRLHPGQRAAVALWSTSLV